MRLRDYGWNSKCNQKYQRSVFSLDVSDRVWVVSRGPSARCFDLCGFRLGRCESRLRKLFTSVPQHQELCSLTHLHPSQGLFVFQKTQRIHVACYSDFLCFTARPSADPHRGLDSAAKCVVRKGKKNQSLDLFSLF